MSESIHFYEPRLGHGLAHDPFNAIVGPRPIGWFSTRSRSCINNLAHYSFFNAFNYTPPIIGFASVGYKDSLRNIEETGEFVWNLVTRPLAEAMTQTSASLPPDTSEFELAGLTPEVSRLVAVPRVKESPVSFECKRTQILQLQTAAGEAVPTWLVLGEVVACILTAGCSRTGSTTRRRQSMCCAAVGRRITSRWGRSSCFGWCGRGEVSTSLNLTVVVIYWAQWFQPFCPWQSRSVLWNSSSSTAPDN